MQTISEQIITIALCVAGTQLTRSLPFAVFSTRKQPPKLIYDLGRKLPLAVFGMLVVYCLKDVDFLHSSAHGLPELTGIAVTAAVHLLKRNMLLSILCGTLTNTGIVNYL